MKGFLGIDNGTQGLSIVFTDEQLNVVATGEASYGMMPNLPEGCYEQSTSDWDDALVKAMKQIHEQVDGIQVLGIGISGQMHGQVLMDEHGKALGPVRLWCDARNQDEGDELTSLFNTKVPKRSTCARFLWTIRNQTELAQATRHITTPAGWTSFRLTGCHTLGIGDASGMFPIDQATMDYDDRLLSVFDELIVSEHIAMSPLRSLLPQVKRAGQDAGSLNETGPKLLGLPVGIPVAAAEGDQPAAMAGSLIAEAGMVSMSFGTSIVANSVGDRAFQGVSPSVDQFCAADGKPINMVWLRNGTTFLNAICLHYGQLLNDNGGESVNGFAAVMPKLVEADEDCGGLVALPFMDDEPGMNVTKGGTALIIGWNTENASAGNCAKAALLAPIFNLKLGCSVLDEQGYPTRTEIILTGGLTKTPECSQIVADVFNTPVTLLTESGEEGSAFGAAIMARYRYMCAGGCNEQQSWSDFITSIKTKGRQRFEPKREAGALYQELFARYKKLVELEPLLSKALS